MNSTIYRLLTAATLAVGLHTASADTGVPKDYPLKKCPVSGESFGEGGMKAFKVSHDGTDVWLCCKSCKKDFDKEPAKFTQIVKDAAKK